MGAVLVVTVIVGVFFVIGLVVGGIFVIALPVLRGRRSRRSDQREPAGPSVQPEYDHAAPDATGLDGTAPDDSPRWPGDGDNGYGGR